MDYWLQVAVSFMSGGPEAAAELLALILLWHYQQAPFKSYYKAGDVKEEPESGSNQRSKMTSWGKKKVLSEWTGVSLFYRPSGTVLPTLEPLHLVLIH